jgi:hypothetical protein
MSMQTDYNSSSGGSLGVGDIIINAFIGTNKNFLNLFLLTIPVYIVYVAAFGSMIFASSAMFTSGNFEDPNAVAAMNIGGSVAFFVLAELVLLIVWLICACAMIRMLHTRYNSMPEPLSSSIKWGAGRILPLVGLALLCGVIYLLFVVAMSILAFLLSVLPVWLSTLAVMLAFGYAIYLAFPYGLAGIVCVGEGKGPIVSLVRSRQLIDSYRWPMLGLIVATFVMLFVIQIVFMFVLGLVMRSLPFGGILAFIAGAFAFPYLNGWVMAIYTIAYNRLNILKGGMLPGPAIANVFE